MEHNTPEKAPENTPENTPAPAPATDQKKWQLGAITAIALLASGIIMAFLALLLPPPGEIHDSVLYIFAQILIYCGSIFGIDTYIKQKNQSRGVTP